MSARRLAETAHWYAASGYRIFPCVPGGKEPLTPNGFLDASADPAVVAAWWTKWPQANIGLPMAPNGLVAVDADVYKPCCGWDDFIVGKEMPDTWTQLSAQGGHHFIFTAPPERRFAGKLAKFVEIKANGYVMAAPSVFGSGRYVRVNAYRPAPAPQWLLDAKPAEGIAADSGSIMGADDLAFFLAGLDPRAHAEHHDWFGIMCACHHVTAGKAEDVFVQWSARNPKFAHLSREVRRRWRSLGRLTGYGVGTLIKVLRDDGRDDLADGLRLMAEEQEATGNLQFQLDRTRLALTDSVVKEFAP